MCTETGEWPQKEAKMKKVCYRSGGRDNKEQFLNQRQHVAVAFIIL